MVEEKTPAEKTGIPPGEACFTTRSPEETRELGRRTGELCRGGEALFLYGDLGSGKTCFVQGLAKGLDLGEGVWVTSPTFIVHAEYRGRLVLNHLDLYRLEEPSALAGFGIDEMLADRGAVTVVEWPEILVEAAGEISRLDVMITDAGDSRREIRFAWRGGENAWPADSFCQPAANRPGVRGHENIGEQPHHRH